MNTRFDVRRWRSRFPGLAREVNGRPAVFLDGPAGSQVPDTVAAEVARAMLHVNANHGGAFVTSVENDAMVERARRAASAFVGDDGTGAIVFGPNMTTLTFALARSLARTWRPGDEVLVTRLDHDANVTPWVLAAEAAGATVRRVPIRVEDGTLDLDAYARLLTPRTRLVAVGHASNALGTVNPVAEITALAHRAGAEVFVDAVHGAPHRLLDVAAWGCDWLACSAYKFFGPHLGMLWGRTGRLAELPVDKVRPASDVPPERWETGTPSYEAIAGTLAAVDYLGEIGRAHGATGGLREALRAAFDAIGGHEHELVAAAIAALATVPGVRVRGITDPARLHERVATLGFTVDGVPAAEIARRLAAQGVFVWSGNFYAVEATRALGLEPDGLVRAGFLHYNEPGEVERLAAALSSSA
jgi:cysteine desulfurase family protein (TIGR01976 family)